MPEQSWSLFQAAWSWSQASGAHAGPAAQFPFPRAARSPTLNQTPVTTGGCHWPKPRASWKRTRTPASFPQSETQPSHPQLVQQMVCHPAGAWAEDKGKARTLGSRKFKSDHHSQLPTVGKSGDLAGPIPHLRAGGRWQQPPQHGASRHAGVLDNRMQGACPCPGLEWWPGRSPGIVRGPPPLAQALTSPPCHPHLLPARATLSREP